MDNLRRAFYQWPQKFSICNALVLMLELGTVVPIHCTRDPKVLFVQSRSALVRSPSALCAFTKYCSSIYQVLFVHSLSSSYILKTALETKGKTAKQVQKYAIYYNEENSCISLSWLPFGLQTGFSIFLKLADPSPCIRFPWFYQPSKFFKQLQKKISH